ncbi:MAG: hypothetical protein ACNS62_10295 [Candidatus Cyclobacteriaceae bacterium M3_2C_046]
MKALVTLKSGMIFLTISSIFWACNPDQYAQTGEYDDVYFTSADRKAVKYAENTQPIPQNRTQAVTPEPEMNNQDNYSAKTVNPEYIARYKRQNQESAIEDQAVNDEEYFVEDYDQDGERDIIINNYNGRGGFSGNYDPFWDDPWWRWNSTAFYGSRFYDPFWGPSWGWRPGLNVNIGWNSGWGMGWSPWRSGWNVSLGWGWGNRGFFDPWMARYDPWYWNSWGSRFNAWDPFYNGFNRGFYNGYFVGNNNRVFYDNDGRANVRDVSRGRYVPRSSSVGVSDRSSGGRSRVVGTNSDGVTRSTNGRIDTRDRSSVQNDYFRRSRNRVENNGTTSNDRARTINRDTRDRSTVASPDRSSRTRATRSSGAVPNYDRNSNRTNSNSRKYSAPSRSSSPSYTPSRSRGSSNSSPSRGRSYSTPSRNSSPSYTPSRSSGSSSYGTRSGSGSGSRSSGSSSGSRRSR